MGRCLEIEYLFDVGGSVNWYKYLWSNLIVFSKIVNVFFYVVLFLWMYFREIFREMYRK